VRGANVFTSGADAGGESSIRERGFTRVSPIVGGGYAIILGRSGARNEPGIRQALALAGLFEGKEYTLPDEKPLTSERLGAMTLDGKTIVLFSTEKFEVSLSNPTGESRRIESVAVDNVGQAVVLSAAQRKGMRVTISDPKARVAFAVLPDFMSGSL
jgi:hypothetical protein